MKLQKETILGLFLGKSKEFVKLENVKGTGNIIVQPGNYKWLDTVGGMVRNGREGQELKLFKNAGAKSVKSLDNVM